MRIFDEFFPEGETFAVLFRRLLPVSAKVCTAIHLVCGVAAFFGGEFIVFDRIPVRGFAGFAISLLMIPPSILIFALIGALNLYFGRKIPGLRVALAPRTKTDSD